MALSGRSARRVRARWPSRPPVLRKRGRGTPGWDGRLGRVVLQDGCREQCVDPQLSPNTRRLLVRVGKGCLLDLHDHIKHCQAAAIRLISSARVGAIGSPSSEPCSSTRGRKRQQNGLPPLPGACLVRVPEVQRGCSCAREILEGRREPWLFSSRRHPRCRSPS